MGFSSKARLYDDCQYVTVAASQTTTAIGVQNCYLKSVTIVPLSTAGARLQFTTAARRLSVFRQRHALGSPHPTPCILASAPRMPRPALRSRPALR